MRLLFIRHAKALSTDEWNEDDLLRPLSKKGISSSEEFFKKLPAMYEIDIILSSKATRALQTAQILKKYYPNAIFERSSLLNPGATFLDLEILLKEYFDYENIALIGHEPDISEIVSKLIGCKFLNIAVKKSSIIELEGININEMELKAIIYPKLLRRLK